MQLTKKWRNSASHCSEIGINFYMHFLTCLIFYFSCKFYFIICHYHFNSIIQSINLIQPTQFVISNDLNTNFSHVFTKFIIIFRCSRILKYSHLTYSLSATKLYLSIVPTVFRNKCSPDSGTITLVPAGLLAPWLVTTVNRKVNDRLLSTGLGNLTMTRLPPSIFYIMVLT